MHSISKQNNNRSPARMSSLGTINVSDVKMTDAIINQKINHQSHHQMVEDPRTLQLALELSLVGLNEGNGSYVQTMSTQGDYELGCLNNIASANYSSTDLSVNSMPPAITTLPNTTSGLLMPSANLDDRSKKSQNMTECVPVPSSEHVAEIVGRQGCKIKALRAKTNTYIKTPVRGEEPVFVVTGRKEDVNKAKREILSAADHFSLIRASRKPSMDGSNGMTNGASLNAASSLSGIMTRTQSGPPCLPGQITIQVRVPYRVVGLVVGPKGATIKHIQQETQTYIVTPSREKEPIFEVTGLPDNVDTARKQIEAHIALRTGNTAKSSDNGTESMSSSEYIHNLHTLTQILNDDGNSDILSCVYNNDSANITNKSSFTNVNMQLNTNITTKTKANTNSSTITNATTNDIGNTNTLNYKNTTHNTNTNTDNSNIIANTVTNTNTNGNIHHTINSNQIFRNKMSFCQPTAIVSVPVCASASANVSGSVSSSHILTRSCSSASSTTSTKSTNNSVSTPSELLHIWKSLNDSGDIDEGIGDSPSIWNVPTTTSVSVATHVSAPHCSPTDSISPTDSLLGEHREGRKVRSSKGIHNSEVSIPLQHHQIQVHLRNTDTHNIHRECFVCNEREVTTALVPCGHNMFCMDCANQICISLESLCPICHSIVYHAMRILA
ncbi:hypothetical protein KR222_005850 [Zaprionus bogoriensis]|nr:hypothetical protein KR222_005850 [Zaprionus bogoriensis]